MSRIVSLIRPIWLLWLLLPLAACGPSRFELARVLRVQHVDGARLPKGCDDRCAGRTLNDPWTRRLSPAERKALIADLSGAAPFGVGLPELLGVDLRPSGQGVEVVNAQPGTAASRCALRPHDTIVALNDRSIDRAIDRAIDQAKDQAPPWSEVMSLLRPPRGERVVLTLAGGRRCVLAPGRLPESAPLQFYRDDERHVVTLGPFGARTAPALLAFLQREAPRQLKLDLRDHPGGALDAMLAVAGALAGPVPLLAMDTRTGTQTLTATGPQRFTGELLVVVNEGTASAAEALAAGLARSGRATLRGQRTFGKCLVHSIADLPEGRGALVTVGRLHLPGEAPWCGTGIAPAPPPRD